MVLDPSTEVGSRLRHRISAEEGTDPRLLEDELICLLCSEGRSSKREMCRQE